MVDKVVLYTKENGRVEMSEPEWERIPPSALEYHREDGPAVEWDNGTKHWFLNGVHHRVDGPAADYINHKEWYIQGEDYTEEEFNNLIQVVRDMPEVLRIG